MGDISKRVSLLLALSLIFSTLPIVFAAEDSWIILEPMQQPRGRLGVAVVEGKIYAIGGDSGYYFGESPSTFNVMGRFHYEATNEEYDPILDEWTFKKPMPTPRYHFGIAVFQNKIYCIGGLTSSNNSSGVETGVNEVYNPTTDTWKTNAPMPTPRMRLDANLVNGKIYLIGGHTFSNHTTLNLCEIYDPEADSWTTKMVFPPYPIVDEASVVIDNKIYFLGTEQSSLPPYEDAFIEIYDPETDSWSVRGPAPLYRSSAVVGVKTGIFAPKRMHVFDEEIHFIYDYTNDSWTTGSSMLTSRGYTGVAVLNDMFYVLGGVILPPLDLLIGEISPSGSNEQYTPIGHIPEFPSWTLPVAGLSVVLVLSIIFRQRIKKSRKT